MAASEQLMAKEAAVRVQLQSAEERQRVVEEENELLRRQLRETHAENVTVIEENRKLAAVLAAEQRQSGIQQEEDQVAIRRLIAAFTSRSEAVKSVVQGVLAPWETALKEEVAEDVRALADMLSHLLQRLQSVETAYAKTDHARLTMLLPVVAKEMSSLLANDEELLVITF
jgi:DNA anti-recombination protein RmuC